MLMSIAALSTVAKTWKQPEQPLTDELDKDVAYTHAEYQP